VGIQPGETRNVIRGRENIALRGLLLEVGRDRLCVLPFARCDTQYEGALAYNRLYQTVCARQFERVTESPFPHVKLPTQIDLSADVRSWRQ
jgi:hypothetical protein